MCALPSYFGHFTHELLELIVLGDEIGFGVHLNDSAAIALHGNAHESVGSGAACLFGGGGETLGAQPVDRGLHVPAGFTKRLLAVHHASAGALAKVLHHCGGDIGHRSILHRLSKLEERQPGFESRRRSPRLPKAESYAAAPASASSDRKSTRLNSSH